MGKRNNKDNGVMFEDHVNRHIRGTLTRNAPYDIETLRTLYEVKGCEMIQDRAPTRKGNINMSTRFGAYKLDKRNHEILQNSAYIRRKRPMYIFALLVGDKIIFKKMSWLAVNNLIRNRYHKSKDIIVINLKDIWRSDGR